MKFKLQWKKENVISYKTQYPYYRA